MSKIASTADRRSCRPAAPREDDDLFKPEIDRGQLRDMLLGSPQPGTVRWGHALDWIGAFSRVRPAVSPAVPKYTGVSFLEAWVDDVENRHADIAELVGAGVPPRPTATAVGSRSATAAGHIQVYMARVRI